MDKVNANKFPFILASTEWASSLFSKGSGRVLLLIAKLCWPIKFYESPFASSLTAFEGRAATHRLGTQQTSKSGLKLQRSAARLESIISNLKRIRVWIKKPLIISLFHLFGSPGLVGVHFQRSTCKRETSSKLPTKQILDHLHGCSLEACSFSSSKNWFQTVFMVKSIEKGQLKINSCSTVIKTTFHLSLFKNDFQPPTLALHLSVAHRRAS